MYKHQVFLSLIYGSGLRLSEALNLKISDIDGHRLQLRINKGKGNKDRMVQIPGCVLELLRTYYVRCKPKLYLFNGLYKGSRCSAKAVQWAIRKAKSRSGIQKTATVHTLRHCYATHHLESGTDLVFLKSQLGHKQLTSTAVYIHLCMEHYRKIHHPIAEMQIRYL